WRHQRATQHRHPPCRSCSSLHRAAPRRWSAIGSSNPCSQSTQTVRNPKVTEVIAGLRLRVSADAVSAGCFGQTAAEDSCGPRFFATLIYHVSPLRNESDDDTPQDPPFCYQCSGLAPSHERAGPAGLWIGFVCEFGIGSSTERFPARSGTAPQF